MAAESKAPGFPRIAILLGLALFATLVMGSMPAADGTSLLPLLMLLGISEVGFIATAIGCFMALSPKGEEPVSRRQRTTGIACGVMAICFAVQGVRLWPL